MSVRMLVTECYDGKHKCQGYNGPADNPNFTCDCICHKLNDLNYNDRYDITIAKGRCFGCGNKVKPRYSGKIRIVAVWCEGCDFDIEAGDAQQITLEQ